MDYHIRRLDYHLPAYILTRLGQLWVESAKSQQASLENLRTKINDTITCHPKQRNDFHDTHRIDKQEVVVHSSPKTIGILRKQ